jgi:hypothetical protein
VIGFITTSTLDSLTKSNYSAIVNIHSLQSTTARSKLSQPVTLSTSRFLVMASNIGDYSASALMPLSAGQRLTNERTGLPQLSSL